MTALITSVLERISGISRWQKKTIVFLLDILLCIQSIWIAYSLRIGVWVYWDFAVQKMVLGALLTMIPVFYFFGVYNAIFRYAGSGMMRTLVRAFLFYSFPFAIIFAVIGVAGVPRTIGVIQPMIFYAGRVFESDSQIFNAGFIEPQSIWRTNKECAHLRCR